MERGRSAILGVCLVTLIAMPGVVAADEGDREPGDTLNALPGLLRVEAPTVGKFRVGVAASAGYGLTEAQDGEDGSHHRFRGILGVSVRPIDWMALALSFDGRYDRHPDDELGSDDGWVGDPRFAARASWKNGDGLGLGAELTLWLPGSDAPSVIFDAASVDARALASYSPPGTGITAIANVGFRLDRSANSVDDPARLRRGDRIALGVSDFDALLLGIGASYRLAALELFGEASWDLLVGGDAPGADVSPIRVAGGARYGVSSAWDLFFALEGVLSSRPASMMSSALVPIDPRITGLVGARWHYMPTAAASAVETEPTEAEEPPTEVDAPTTGILRGRVLAPDGTPIAGARVSTASEPVREATSANDGSYEFLELAPGELRLAVVAEGYEDAERTVNIVAGQTATDAATLARITRGQLRGLVRDFRGRPLGATVQVLPIDTRTRTDSDGRFEIDVPAGEYEVVIEAPAHKSQRRRVTVEENGVTVLNADMRRGR